MHRMHQRYNTYSVRDDSCGSLFFDGRDGRWGHNLICEEPVFIGDVNRCMVGTDCTDCGNCAETLPLQLADLVWNASQSVNQSDPSTMAEIARSRTNASILEAAAFPTIGSDAVYTVTTFTYAAAFGALAFKLLMGYVVTKLEDGQ